jgi:hypothetical protein
VIGLRRPDSGRRMNAKSTAVYVTPSRPNERSRLWTPVSYSGWLQPRLELLAGDFLDAFGISLRIKMKSQNYSELTIPEDVCDRVLG